MDEDVTLEVAALYNSILKDVFGEDGRLRFSPLSCRENAVHKSILRDMISHMKATLVKQRGLKPVDVWKSLRAMFPSYNDGFNNFYRNMKGNQFIRYVSYVRKYVDRKDLWHLKPNKLMRELLSSKDIVVSGVKFSSTDWQKVMVALDRELSRPTINKIKKEFND